MNSPPKKKVLLIGWDAADWKVINPLLDAGKMPHLNTIIDQGVMGNLATLSPLISPMLWTSIATGKRPFKHGIMGFTEPDPNGPGIRPVSNFSRRTRAIWNILQLNGLKSNIVGWWPSHPVEPISGTMVSNHFHLANAPFDKPWLMRPGTVHPLRLKKNLADLRLHPGEILAEQIAHFVPDFDKIDQNKDHRLELIAKTIAECTSVHTAATALIQLEDWDFMAVYYDAIDHFSHGFMRYHPPRMDDVPEHEFDLFKGVVETAYRFHDMMLGVLLSLAGEETRVILVSDHGFHTNHMRTMSIPADPAGPTIQHRNHGILVMKGPGIKKDELVHGANLLDITPTILQLYDLPIGEDMDGIPLIDCFTDPAPVSSIPSWDSVAGIDGSHPEELVIDPVESREALNQLVALGYIEAPDEDVKKTIIRTVRELDYNLARSYTDANRHFDAIPYLAELSENFPDDERFSMTLFHCYHALDEVDKAGRLLEVIVQRKKETIKKARQELADWEKKNALTKPEDLNETQRYDLHRIKSRATANPIGMDYLMVEQLVAKGDFKSALQHLEQIEMLQPDNLGLHIKKGGVYLKLRQYNKATAYFRRALSNDTENVAAYVGLSRTHIYRNRNEDAAQDALAAIGLAYFNPSAHFLLGVALHRMGRLQQAVDALKIAILQNPNFMIAYQRLINIYKKELNDPETAEKYEVRADAAHKRIQDLKAGKVKYHKNPLPNHVASTSDQTAKKSDRKLPGKIRTKLSGTILVVSGLPRSGTSMMMQMLTAGGLEPQTDARRQADIHNEKGYFEDSRIKALQQDNSWLEEIIGKSVKIVAQLLLELPARKKLNYGVIFMERDLDSVMTSQRNFLSDQGDNGAKIPDMLLKQVFHSQLLQVKEFLAARKIPVLYIRYENCIEDPEATAESINRFLGRGLDKKAMAEAIQPSLQRHRKN